MAYESPVEPAVSLLGTMGSRAYGLAHENSDTDKLGVYTAPVREVLGLHGAAVCEDSIVVHDPDLTLHELAKFCRLALKSNPTLLELLWLGEYEVCDEIGTALVALKDYFPCSDAVRGAWGGFCSQLAKKSRGYSTGERSEHDLVRAAKTARHCWRLLLQGTEFLQTGVLRVDVSDLRDEIFSIGELAVGDIDRFGELVEAKLSALDNVSSVLADHPLVYKVNEFLVATRLASL